MTSQGSQTSNENVVNKVAEDACHWVIKSVCCTMYTFWLIILVSLLCQAPPSLSACNIGEKKESGLGIGLITVLDPTKFNIFHAAQINLWHFIQLYHH